MGGGACMATACDFRIAGETARFAYPEIDRGMNLQWGGLALCLRLIGPARTKQMVGLGDAFAAPQLESWGYVDAVTAPGEAPGRSPALGGALRRQAAPRAADDQGERQRPERRPRWRDHAHGRGPVGADGADRRLRRGHRGLREGREPTFTGN